jgi:hypothetical protein
VLNYRDRKIVSVEPSPAFDANQWQAIDHEIETCALVGPEKSGTRLQLQQASLDLDAAVASTDGLQVRGNRRTKEPSRDELMDTDEWNWSWGLKQSADNREDLGGPAADLSDLRPLSPMETA